MCLHIRIQFWFGERNEPLFLIKLCRKTPFLLFNCNTCKRQIKEDSNFFFLTEISKGLIIKIKVTVLVSYDLVPSAILLMENRG